MYPGTGRHRLARARSAMDILHNVLFVNPGGRASGGRLKGSFSGRLPPTLQIGTLCNLAMVGDVSQVVQISGVCSRAMRQRAETNVCATAHRLTPAKRWLCCLSLACGRVGTPSLPLASVVSKSGDAGHAGNGGTPAIVGRARLDRAPRVRVRPRAEAAYSWPVEARYFFKFRQWLYSAVDADQPSGPRPGAKWRCWVGWLPTDQRGSARR